MLPNESDCAGHFSPAQPVVLCQLKLGLDPEFGLSSLSMHVHMNTRFFAGEKIESKPAASKYGRTHLPSYIITSTITRFTFASAISLLADCNRHELAKVQVDRMQVARLNKTRRPSPIHIGENVHRLSSPSDGWFFRRAQYTMHAARRQKRCLWNSSNCAVENGVPDPIVFFGEVLSPCSTCCPHSTSIISGADALCQLSPRQRMKGYSCFLFQKRNTCRY